MGLAGERSNVAPDDERRADCLRLVVHDLNNPLTAIRILAEMSRDAIADPDLRQDMIDVLEAADFASALLEGLSSMVRLERGGDDCTWFPLDLVEVVRSTVDRPALRRHVKLDLPQEVQIGGDRSALGRALTDVLINARRLADTRSPVTLSVVDGPVVEVRVRHPSPGAPAMMRDELFDLFGAVELRQNAIPVSAVGLAFARKVVAEHGGQIGFEDGPGGAMDLVIRLPR
jgi:signal transduction histidine kinase